MKTAHDPRHQKRRETIQFLFAQSFAKQPNLNDLAKDILNDKDKLDIQITQAAPEWPDRGYLSERKITAARIHQSGG